MTCCQRQSSGCRALTWDDSSELKAAARREGLCETLRSQRNLKKTLNVDVCWFLCRSAGSQPCQPICWFVPGCVERFDQTLDAFHAHVHRMKLLPTKEHALQCCWLVESSHSSWYLTYCTRKPAFGDSFSDKHAPASSYDHLIAIHGLLS